MIAKILGHVQQREELDGNLAWVRHPGITEVDVLSVIGVTLCLIMRVHTKS